MQLVNAIGVCEQNAYEYELCEPPPRRTGLILFVKVRNVAVVMVTFLRLQVRIIPEQLV